jgi:hypothetical protein
MSKNYDLYPASERKIDNWRRRILGYEKMKRDLQRQIQILKNKNKKQKEVIDKAIEYILECSINEKGHINVNLSSEEVGKLLDILNEALE